MTATSFDELDLAPRPCRSVHLLRRLRAGELDVAAAETARAHVAGCAVCRARTGALDGEERQAKEALPFSRFAAAVAQKAARPRRRPLPVVGAALAAGLALAAAVPLLNDTPTTRTKGGADLLLYAGGVGEPRPIGDGAALQPGEAVRLRVSTGEHAFVTVVSIDEGGRVTPLYPQRGASLRVERGGQTLLPHSVAFDGAGRERLIALFSDRPLSAEVVSTAARQAFARAGALDRMGPLALGAQEIDRTVIKPSPLEPHPR